VHFDLSDLRLFLAIAEAGNLTRGARRVFLSPPAASARLKSLESELRAQLFYRDSRGVSLTSAGETLLRHARLIIRQVEHVKSEFGVYGAEATGHIRIFANTTAVTEFMPELLARFLAERPGVTVDLQERLTQDIVRSVVDGSSDLGITSGPVATEELQVIHFSTDRLVLATPVDHVLARRRSVPFADSLRYEHIGLHEGSTLLAFLRSLMEKNGYERALRIQVRSFEAMCRMVEAGVGVGVVPESAALRHARTMKLGIVELEEDWAVRERVVLVRELEALPGCAQALVRKLLESGSGGSSVPPVKPAAHLRG
jgi:DNA-binding transcriptional LysR family regulator